MSEINRSLVKILFSDVVYESERQERSADFEDSSNCDAARREYKKTKKSSTLLEMCTLNACK